jgi:hypothetical protein
MLPLALLQGKPCSMLPLALLQGKPCSMLPLALLQGKRCGAAAVRLHDLVIRSRASWHALRPGMKLRHTVGRVA